MADRLIHELRVSDSDEVNVPFSEFGNDDEIVAFARALHRNQYVNRCTITFRDNVVAGDFPVLDWTPLLNELRTREGLEEFHIRDTPDAHLNRHPQFRDQLFRALQQNAALQRLFLFSGDFSNNNSDWIVNLLDNSRGLKYVSFGFCRTDVNGGLVFAAALSRNNRIGAVHFEGCSPSLVCPFLETLASSDTQSSITKFTYSPGRSYIIGRGRNMLTPAEQNSILEVMRQYLESPTVSTQVLELDEVMFSRSRGGTHLTQGLSQNTSVRELILDNCSFGDEEDAQMLANLLRRNPNLATVRLREFRGGYLNSPDIVGALVANFAWRDTPLRLLEIHSAMANAGFNTLVTALTESTSLEHLVLKNLPHDAFWPLRDNLSSLKIKTMTLQFSSVHFERIIDGREGFLQAIRRNYIIQRVQCTVGDHLNFFMDAHQSRLEYYLERNSKLAQWAENPETVPRELWQYALMLALKAGINSLHQSLLALSGQDIGLRQQSRKRKRPRYYKP